MAAENIPQCPQCGATLQPSATVCWLCQPYGGPVGTPSGLHYSEPPVPNETFVGIIIRGVTAVAVVAGILVLASVALFAALLVVCSGLNV